MDKRKHLTKTQIARRRQERAAQRRDDRLAPPVNDPEQLLTNRQAALLLGCSPLTLEQWRFHKRYNIPYIKLDRAVRYRRADVVAFIQARLKTPKSEAA